MTNFDFLKDIPQFAAFADVAVAAEKILMIDPEASVMNCRRAMEFAVKWMYSVDDMLVMPYQDKLVSLLNTEEFKGIVDADILRRMDFIRRVANQVAHTGRKLTLDQAKLCLENLYIFLDFLAYCYADDYQEGQYGRRPVIFLTNGFETRIVDGQYPERQVSCIYSRRDLEKWFNLKTMRGDLGSVRIDKKIAGRYYQEMAICGSLSGSEN